jgi:hypothetical protein
VCGDGCGGGIGPAESTTKLTSLKHVSYHCFNGNTPDSVALLPKVHGDILTLGKTTYVESESEKENEREMGKEERKCVKER